LPVAIGELSPKFHEYEYGVVPPVVVAVNVTVVPIVGELGLNWKSVLSGCGVTVIDLLALADARFISVTVATTMNVPFVV
jgi:hypothetical protein